MLLPSLLAVAAVVVVVAVGDVDASLSVCSTSLSGSNQVVDSPPASSLILELIPCAFF